MNEFNALLSNATKLLSHLIATPSISSKESESATVIVENLERHHFNCRRLENNVWAANKHFDENKPTILLNSHHDTVKPAHDYSINPFEPIVTDGRLYGLGSNDAGASLVALLATFVHFHECYDLKYNLIFAASAEEEISGKNGISALIPALGPIDCAIVGEPTGMQMAVAEKGLMVLDCVATGISGHAARSEGDNAIYLAMKDINWFAGHVFQKKSDFLGDVHMSVTLINAGTLHNVIPSECRFTVDVRINELYTHEEVLATVQKHISSTAVARSMRLRSSSIAMDHPLVAAGTHIGLTSYGSPTLSDKALMPFPALKIGPGESSRSHKADEFIYLDELKHGIETYIDILNRVL